MSLSLNSSEALILITLNENKEGLQIDALIAKSNNQLKKRSLYVLLNRMMDKGYIIVDKNQHTSRAVYIISDLGNKMLEAFYLSPKAQKTLNNSFVFS